MFANRGWVGNLSQNHDFAKNPGQESWPRSCEVFSFQKIKIRAHWIGANENIVLVGTAEIS